MRSCFPIVSLLFYWAIPGSTHNWQEIGDNIDPTTMNNCKCPVEFAGTVRCGGEINNANPGKKHHKHCHPRVIYACDPPILASSGYYHARTTSKRLDACDRDETCMMEGATRFCQYSKDPGYKKRRVELSNEEPWSQESQEEPPPVPADKLISGLSNILKVEKP